MCFWDFKRMGLSNKNHLLQQRAVIKWADPYREDCEQVRALLIDEAYALSKVHHPSIAALLDFGDNEHGTYLAIEYIEGIDLRRVLSILGAKNQRIPLDLACFITNEILRGLQEIHSAKDDHARSLNMIHRDVNPSNIILASTGYVKLTDFGTVHMLNRTQSPTDPGRVKGKIRYLAPEYIADNYCTQLSDIYSVGVTLFEMLTGKPSFVGPNNVDIMVRIVRDGLPYGLIEQESIPNTLINIIKKATTQKPKDRFKQAIDFIEEIENWMHKNSQFVSPSRLSKFLLHTSAADSKLTKP